MLCNGRDGDWHIGDNHCRYRCWYAWRAFSVYDAAAPVELPHASLVFSVLDFSLFLAESTLVAKKVDAHVLPNFAIDTHLLADLQDSHTQVNRQRGRLLSCSKSWV